MAGMTHFALQAVFGQRFHLIPAELSLLVRGDELNHVGIVDITQQVVGLHVMVAGVEVTIMLHGQGIAAGGAEDAQAVLAYPTTQGDVEELHIDFAYIAPHPFLKYGDQKLAILFGLHRPFRNQAAFLQIERPLAPRPLAPAHIGQGQEIGRGSFDDRYELDKIGLQLIAEKTINLQRVAGIGGVNGAQDIVFHLMFAQDFPAAHDLVKTTRSPLVHPVGIVDLLGPVDAEPNEEIILFEESTPLIVQLGAIGLHGMADPLARPFVLIHIFDRKFKKVQPHQGRFTALPGHGHLGSLVRFQQLPDIGFQQFISHTESAAGIKHFLGKEEAVFAVEIADGPGWFDQYMVSGRGIVGHCKHVFLPVQRQIEDKPTQVGRFWQQGGWSFELPGTAQCQAV